MPVQKTWQPRIAVGGFFKQVCNVIAHAVITSVPACAFGLAVPAVIQRHNAQSRRVEHLRHMGIAPAVLAQPVHQHHHGARLPIRAPFAPIKSQPIG